MSRIANILGWLVFFASILGAVFHWAPDDPLTALLKSKGDYGYVMTGMACLLVGAIAWLIYETRKLAKAKARLEQVRNRKL